jgi:dienelactone hydrolase
MIQDYFVARVREVHAERKSRLLAIKNRHQAEQYQEYLRDVIKKIFYPLPVKTPLNPEITGILERPGYRIEKLIFESRPGCFVTGNLYLPEKIKQPAPAVLAPCGHSQIGKAEPLYQEFCQRLAKAGLVVLIYDPFNQGERDQYFKLPSKETVRQSCTWAHNMMGKQLELVGEWFGTWRLWDGIRALDYLLSRPEVDKTRIGITGNSGGGTLTTWLWASDNRFTMAAPSCFITTFLANLENELPADCEQYPPGALGYGLEQADFLLAQTPKPILLLGQKYDYFDCRGLREAYADLKRFYRFFGAAEKVQLFVGTHIHGYYPENQQAMTAFFCKHAGLKTPSTDVQVRCEEPKTLWATGTGQVVPTGARPIYELIAEIGRQMARKRKRISNQKLIQDLEGLLHIPARKGIPHYRILRPVIKGKNTVAKYAVETETNIKVILRKQPVPGDYAWTFNVERTIHLYLPHVSSQEDISKDTLVKSLMAKGVLYSLDVRGLGQSLPCEISQFFHPYGKDYMYHGYSLMLNESYLGRRVYDVLRVIDLLVGEGAKEIHLYGRGQGAILAIFSSLLHPRVKSITLKNCPVSFHSWTQVPLVSWPAANFPFGILKKFDLPDCLRVLGRKVKVIGFWDPEMKPERSQ